MDTQNSNLNKNVLILRKRLKLTQTDFLKLYLSDENGTQIMSLSKFSNFENRGNKDEEMIVNMISSKLNLDPSLFAIDSVTFSQEIEHLLAGLISENEQNQALTQPESNVVKLVSVINDYLVESILAGELSPGMKLPSDRDLAEKFKVGRTIIREALKALHVLGLIDILPGKGTFIATGSQHFFIAPLSWSFYMDSQHINHALDLRSILEKQCAKLAAMRQNDACAEKLTEVYQKSDAAYKSGDFDSFLDLDRDFHLAIGECAENPIILNLLLVIRKLVQQESKLGLTTAAQFEEVHAEHTTIYEAIMDKNPDLAQKAMSQHLEKFYVRSHSNKMQST